MSEKMTTSEPTTGEIVRALREHAEWAQANEWECPITLGDVLRKAADRLESQEQTIAALTARAEQAEAREKAAIKALTEYEDAVYPTVEDVMRDLNTL